MPCACLVAQLCPTLCDPMDCSPPDSSVHRIFQARILEWDAILSPDCPDPRIEPMPPVSPALHVVLYRLSPDDASGKKKKKKKNLPVNAGGIRDVGSIPGSGRSPGGGHGHPIQYSCLKNPMDGGAIVSQTVEHD